MPTTNSQNSHLQQDSRRRTNSLLHSTRTSAHRTAHYRDERAKRQLAKTDHEFRHPEYVNAVAGKLTGNYIIAGSVIAVILIDTLLFGAMAEFLVRLGFSGNPSIVWAAKILLPIMVVWLELKIATLIALEQEKFIEGMGRTREYWFYLLAGIILVCVMPAISLATTLALRAGTPAGARIAFDAMSIGLALLALIAHGLVLFGGQSANRAMGHLVFNARQWQLKHQIQRFDIGYRRESGQLIIVTTNYINALTNHNTTYADARIEPGPFDRLTREIVNEVFGYEVIMAPVTPGDVRGTVTNGTTINQPPNPPSPAPQPNAERPAAQDEQKEEPASFSQRDEGEVRL